MSQTSNGFVQSIDKQFEPIDKKFKEFFIDKAPFSIPENIKEIFVVVIPYLNVLSIIFTALALVTLVGLGSFLLPLAMMASVKANVTLNGLGLPTMVLHAISLVLSLLAMQGLFKRQHTAWKYKVYQTLLGVLVGLMSFNILSTVIGGVIGLFILYQIKNKYTN